MFFKMSCGVVCSHKPGTSSFLLLSFTILICFYFIALLYFLLSFRLLFIKCNSLELMAPDVPVNTVVFLLLWAVSEI